MLTKKVVKALIALIIGQCCYPTKLLAKLSGSLSPEAISERLKPVAKENIETTSSIAAAAPLQLQTSAAKIYQDNCKVCHQQGIAGAPRFANKQEWEPRLKADGLEGMLQKAFDGFRGMPPKGNCLSCTKEDLKHTIEYMLEAIK